MTTRLQLRTRVRLELGDAGGAQLWSDAQLDEWLAEAIRDYAVQAPRAAATSIASVAGQAEYELPSDCLEVVRVEHPSGFLRVFSPPAGGDVLEPLVALQGTPRVVAAQLSYEVWGSYGALTLTLAPAPSDASDAIKVRYRAQWAEPGSDGATLATPPVDDHLLKWFVCEAALQWLGTDEAKRQRWERQRGISAAVAGRQYGAELRRAYEQKGRRVVGGRLVVRE